VRLLDGYDLSYAELLAVGWSPERGELSLRLRAPEAGWALRQRLRRPAPSREVSLELAGVTALRETLLSRGHEVGDGWPDAIVFEIDELVVAGGRLRLLAEGLELEFAFRECRIGTQEPADGGTNPE
jgi:hypothetical protein